MTATLPDRPRRTRRRRPTRALTLGLLLASVVLLAACSDAHTAEEKEEAESGIDPRVITVFQPPQLIPAMKALATEFGRDHPEVAFVYDTQPSSSQRKRVEAGAKPSIWIDAEPTITEYEDDPRSQGAATTLGFDVLQFVVRAGNPKGINSLTVFGPDGGPFPTARTGLCKVDVRCGSVAGKLLVSQDIDATPTTRTADGDLLVAAIVADTLDTGLVYRTSAAPAGAQLATIPLENPSTGLVEYRMLRFTDSSAAAEFETWLGSEQARAVLLAQGLLPAMEPE